MKIGIFQERNKTVKKKMEKKKLKNTISAIKNIGCD
jgi:hypothetical protein